MRYYLSILTIVLVSFHSALSQTAISPVDIPIYLSGNFGELRNNHFHSGIDFKTQGRTGLPIKAVKEGYVSRINISPSGYGRALYIDHPDGTTTVYAHLDRFNKAIESFAVDSQYIKQSFRIDMKLAPGQFPVKQGEIIAYSGNTGSSGGPHLHFELRETSTEEPHDPLVLYTQKIADKRAPEVRSFMLYPQKGQGLVNGKSSKLMLSFKKDKNGKTSLAPLPVKVWGKVGFAVRAYDYINTTPNVLGVKEIILKIDSNTVYHSDMTHFSFAETRYLNSFIDWEEWTVRKSFYMKSFIEPGNKLRIYRGSGDGIVDFNEERTYRVEYILRDLHGNTTTHTFNIQASRQNIPPYRPSGIYMLYGQDNLFEQDGISLSIPKGNLYTDIAFDYTTGTSGSPFSPLFQLGERTPLHSFCPLSLPVANDLFPAKEKYGIVQLIQGKKNWIGGSYKEGKLQTRIRELGSFFIDIDTIPPKVSPLNKANWAKNKNIAFKISDSQSGIASWTANLNGQFVLFELDAKRDLLFCQYDPRRMPSGKCLLFLEVKDGCNNITRYEETINW